MLNEDIIKFDFISTPVKGVYGIVINDLIRKVQPFLNYRLDDLIELDDRPLQMRESLFCI